MTTKYWNIVDGKIPDDLEAEMDRLLADYSPEKVLGNPVRPPWIAFPEYPPSSMGWRMGGGEDFMTEFCKWYEAQSLEKRAEFKSKFPTPPEWDEFMKRRDANNPAS